MRPIKLSMTAFGPFIGTETVDFEVFGKKPLFLINGATGAGKTTILDAICFALYGQTTGKEREAVQMRCDYADDNTTTSVEFVFELGEQRYRIVRVPEQTRAKKSGEGVTTQKPRAELWLVKGKGEATTEKVLVPEKVTEATQKIEELTGLLVDQFRQVMVLPQGKFRRLLMADSKDREQIFGQLFATGIYKKIEDKLKQLAATVEVSVRTLKNEQYGVLQTVGFEEVDALQEAMTDVVPELEVAAKQKQSMESAYLVALKADEAAKALDQGFSQLKTLSAEREALEQQSRGVTVKLQRLNLVDQALKIKPIFADKARFEFELKGVALDSEVADKSLQQSVETLENASKDLKNSKSLEKEKDQLMQRAELLKSYRQRASKVYVAEGELKQIEEIHQTNVVAQEAEVKRQEQTQADIKQGEVEKKRFEKLLLKEVEVAASTQKLTQAVATRQRYEALLVEQSAQEKRFAEVTKIGKQAAENKQQKETESKQLEQAWHAGQAAILARELKQDQPCLVCGSSEHPAPAQATIDLPSDAQREAAQQALEAAQAELLKAREEYSKLKSGLEALQPQLVELMAQLDEYGTQSLTQLKLALKESSDQSQGLKETRVQLVALDKQLDQFKQTLEIAEKQLKQVQQQFNDSQMQLQTRRTELDAAQKELPEEYRQSGKLETDVTETEASMIKLEQQIEAAQQVHIEASKQHSTAEANLQALKVRQDALQISASTSAKQWQTALEQSVFASVEEFSQADLSSEEQERIKAEVDSYKTKLQTLTGAIQEREKSLVGKEQPDLAVLQLALEKALEDKNQTDLAWQQIDKHLNILQEAEKAFAALTDKLKAYDKEYKVIGTLSDVANGKIGNKISLQRFVLGVLLDDVLLAASTRLTLMSKGRYNLIRKEDRAKGNKASGLEMEVEDTYTGKIRAVSTLSGGEAFLASLSLALGLSDVVQAYAGGIRLETLFIDEGFGSLDSGTLDLAIKTLIDLRNTGRMVGIISHVSELKEQIPLRLDVVAGRQGSRVELVY